MPLDALLTQTLQNACRKLKERVEQAFQPSTEPAQLPAEVASVLQHPQRADRSVLLSLFNTIVGTASENGLGTALYNLIAQTNPRGPAGVPHPGAITQQLLHSIHLEARQIAARRERDSKKKQLLEDRADEALIIDDAAGNEDDEEDIYETYRAAMVKGAPHPDSIVETASLASVRPPKPTYRHHLQAAETRKLLSDAQLETIVYANMRFQTKVEGGATGGFFLGDGAGVGKGRQIAALILEHRLTGGRRCLWVSTSNDLRFDAARDLNDVGAEHIRVFPEGTAALPKGKLRQTEGVLFITYALLVSGLKDTDAENATKDAEQEISARITKGSRLEQVVEWLRGDEKSLIVMDECHKAKNLLATKGKSTQTGKAILKLQMNLPQAQVLYSSATGASEPHNLAYMVRLGTCGFKNMPELVNELSSTGLGSLEMFSMGLKATGSYVSRALSYKGAEFMIAKIRMDPVFKVMYDRSCEFWHLLLSIVKSLVRRPKRLNGLFFAAQQRFYRQMLMAAKVPETAKLAQDAVRDGMCVVIGLQSTGEANTEQVRDQLGDAMDDFVSAPRQVLLAFLENHFPNGKSGLSDRELDTLHAQVYVAVTHWKNLLPAEEQARRDREHAAAARNSRAQHPSSSAAAAASESDDDVAAIESLTLDQVIERQTEEAKRSGRYIDLTVGDNNEEVRIAQNAIKQEVAQEAEQEVRSAQAAANQKRDKELAEAQAGVEEAQQLLQSIREQLEACNPNMAATTEGETARKRLRRATNTSTRSKDSWDLSSEDEDEWEPTEPVQKPAAKRRAVLVLSDSDEENVQPPNGQRTNSRSTRMPQRKAASSSVICIQSDSDEEVISPAKPPATRSDSSPVSDDDSEDEDEDDICCVVCKQSDRADCMLMCDTCDGEGAHHMDCLNPPLTELPEGDWFCPKCASEATTPSAPACTACSQRNSQGSMVTCSKCNLGPRHIACLNPPQSTKPAVFTCSRCKSSTDAGKLARGFVSSNCPNRGALLLRERAAMRRLEQAQQQLSLVEAPKSTDARQQRAARRASGGLAAESSRAAGLRSPGESSYGDDEDASDEEFNPESEHVEPRAPQRDVKPKGPAQYKYSTKREALTDTWEEEVDAQGPSDWKDACVGAATEEEDSPHPVMIRIRNILSRVVQSMELPANPLDQLTELMGGTEKVAEMTGRKGQLVPDEANGGIKYQQRRQEEALKDINRTEKRAFMNGEKLIAIISEAASTGISLQADKRVPNQRRRCHLTLELPWSADKAIQQFGRSHRSNQTSAPIYRIIVTECAGEYRFAASAAKRLQSLGALLKGDRRALGAGVDLKEFDCDNKYGQIALKRIFNDMTGTSSAMPGVNLPAVPLAARVPGVNYDEATSFYDYLKPRLAEVGMMEGHSAGIGHVVWREEEKVIKKVSTWLNRVLALALQDQALIFEYFSDTLDAVIEAAKSSGTYDHGITSLHANSVTIAKQMSIHRDVSGAETYYSLLHVDRGLPWEDAMKFRDDFNDAVRAEGRPPSAKSGFYIDLKKHGINGMPYVLLATEQKRSFRNGNRQFRIQRPNISACPHMNQAKLEGQYRRVNDDRAQGIWQYWFQATSTDCLHGPKCAKKHRKPREECDFGTRLKKMHVISGAVLPVLKHLYSIVHNSGYNREASTGKKQAPKVIRAKLDGGGVIVGMDLHPGDAMLFVEKLRAGDFTNEAAMAADGAYE